MSIFKIIKNFFSYDIAIDLGSENTSIYVKNEGIKLQEPTLVSFKHSYGEREFIKFGSEAKKLIGRTPKDIEVVRPINKGAIVDLTATEVMLEYFISQVHEETFFRPSPSVLIAIPSSSSEIEKKAIEDAIYNAGAKDVIFVKQGMAAALGAGMDVSSTTPSCIIDIGADTSEISVIASSGIIFSKTFHVGGVNMAESIADRVLDEYQIYIGVENAEKLVRNLATVNTEKVDETKKMIIKGKDALSNKPKTIEVTQKDVYYGLFEPMSTIIESLNEVFRNLPAETVGDLYQNGIVLVGGTSKIDGLVDLIEGQINLKTVLCEDPMNAVIKGCGMILDDTIGFIE